MRRELIAPVLARMLERREVLGLVRARVSSAAAGAAEREDLVFLDRYCQDYEAVARLLEGESHPVWQQLAAQLEALAGSAEELLRRHLR